MCFFITVVADEPAAEELSRALGPSLALTPQRNAALAAQAGGKALWSLTSRGCACDLFRQAAPPAKEEKYAKRGWSQAKIRRAIEQARSSEQSRATFTGLRRDVREALLRAAPIGFFVHWYRGDVSIESFTLREGGERSDLDGVTADHLYWIRH